MELVKHSTEEEEEEEDEIGEIFVICCPQDREFAKRKLCPALRTQSDQSVSLYSGSEMDEATALSRIADSAHCCVVNSAAGINALQLQLAGVSPARYRAVDLCTIRHTAEPNSEIVGELEAGTVIDVNDAAVDTTGVIRLCFDDGWVAYKKHLLERLSDDEVVAESAQASRNPRARRARRARSRRHSVAEDGVQGVTMLGETVAKDLGLVEERVFTVGQAHLSKAPHLVQLKVGGMGLTVFDGATLLESHLYSTIKSWEVANQSKILILQFAGKAKGKKPIEVKYEVLGDDGPAIAKLMEDHAKAVFKTRVEAKKQKKNPTQAAEAEEDSDSEEEDKEAEATEWWDDEMRRQEDRLNLFEERSLRDFFATQLDASVHFSGAASQVSKSDGSEQKCILVVSKRALYRMHHPMPRGTQPWACKGRTLIRRVTELEVSTHTEDQLIVRYRRRSGRISSHMFSIDEDRRDQLVRALQKIVMQRKGSHVPLQVSENSLFGKSDGPAQSSIAGNAFTKDTYGDNPVREGDDAAELCFTTLIGMISATKAGMQGDVGQQYFSSVEFDAEDTKSFPAAGSVDTPPHNYADFEFTTYAPAIFKRIRELANISDEQYLSGLTGLSEEQLFSEDAPDFVRNGLPEGASLCPMFTNSKSGAFFFFTTDMCYLVKTVGADEVQVLRKMLSDYLAHYERNDDSLINKIVGAYSSSLCKDPFIVMMSTFPLSKDIAMHEVYDLKGSMHGREIKEKEKRAKVVIYKDNDFDSNPQRAFKLSNEKRTWFLGRLKADVEFLRRHQLIDYSMLLGIHFRDKKGGLDIDSTNGIQARDGVQEVYYCEIIDYLIQYGGKKKMEHKLRGGMVNRMNKKSRDMQFSALSVTEPNEYSERMVAFITEKTPQASMIAYRRRSSTLSLAAMPGQPQPPQGGGSGMGSGAQLLPGMDAAAMAALANFTANNAEETESPRRNSLDGISEIAETAGITELVEEEEEEEEEEETLGDIGEGEEEEENDDLPDPEPEDDHSELLGTYKILNPCSLRKEADIKSNKCVDLDPGEQVKVVKATKLANGTTRLQCDQGWLSLKPHLVEKIADLEPEPEPEPEPTDDVVGELPQPRKMKKRRGPAASGRDRRHSVAVQQRSTGGTSLGGLSGDLTATLEEKVFQVTQTHIKKAPDSVELKIGGMGLTLFAKGSLLQSFLYQDLAAWSSQQSDQVFSVETKAGASYDFGTQGEAMEMAKLMQAHAKSVVNAQAANRANALLGEYRVKARAVVRKGMDIHSEKAGDLEPGQVIEVTETSVNSDGVVRLRCTQGWLSNKSHLVEKIEPGDSSSPKIASSSMGSPRRLKRSRSRRASVAVTDVSRDFEELAKSLGIAEEKVFNVQQSHIKKAPKQVQLKVGGMGLQFFHDDVQLESILYNKIGAWNATKALLIVELKGEPTINLRTSEASDIAMLMKTHAESVANMHRQKKDVKTGSIQEKAQLLRSSSRESLGPELSLVKSDDRLLSPGLDSELGSAKSRVDSDFSGLESPRDISPSPTPEKQSAGAETTIRLFNKVVDLLETNPDRVTSLWVGAYVDVEDHGKLLKHFTGTNPFVDQPPFNSSTITKGGRTTFVIMDALLDAKGVQVDPRDAESIIRSLHGHASLVRSTSMDWGDANSSNLMEGVPPKSPRILSLTPSPAGRHAAQQMKAIGDKSTASPAPTDDLDDLDAMERAIAALGESSPAADTEVAALKEQLEQQAQLHAKELAAAKEEAEAARAAAADAGAKAKAAIAEVTEASVDAESSRLQLQQQAQEQEHNRNERAALDASLRALEAEMAEVKRERDMARAQAERADSQARVADATAKAAAASAATDVASVSAGQGDQVVQIQKMSARHQAELAALSAERDDLLRKREQERVELHKAREASSEYAQQLREQEAEHRAAEAARSLEHSKLKADMAERAEVVASMAAAAAVSVDDIDETVRLQRRVQVLEEQLATGRQTAVSAQAADTSIIQIELERVEAENRGLQDELAIQQERRVKQSTEHAELLAENSKLHAQLRRQASAQQVTVSELQELRTAYDDLVNVTHKMSSSAVVKQSLDSGDQFGQAAVSETVGSPGSGNGFESVRSRAQAVQRQVEALEQEMRDLVITSPFSPGGEVSALPQLSASRSTSRGSALSSPVSSSFEAYNSPRSQTGEESFNLSTASPERSARSFELGDFLRQHELGHYEDALRKLGAESMDGLRNTSLSDLNDLGMTTVEKLRFRRSFKSS